MGAPTLAAMLPVEDVLQSLALPDKRLTLHRIFFDLYAPTFPARARLPVATVWCGGAGQYNIEVRLLSPEGKQLASDGDEFAASNLHAHVLTLNVLLPAPGPYQLAALLEGEVVATLPLVVAMSVGARPDDTPPLPPLE